ncbi:hypothetical protein [Shimia sp. Alg240-R146]|uniref:hypothetical protein n=1 Tax=Shimia sp. Alg240-R146 TaxID=2993449 RepID=UPI0022E6177F|nr:hypothetical protein [Shimia sp. Alg240-R146]
MVEKLVGSTTVVLARPSPTNPFQFVPAEHLFGAEYAEPIPQLVDSITRRKISNTPQDRVLFAVNSASEKWERVGYIDADMRPILSEVMFRLPEWRSGNTEDRAAFFAGLLGHEVRSIHHLALRELDLLEYGELKSLGLEVDATQIMARLNILSETDLTPIRVLLLGLSSAPGLENFFRKRVEVNSRIDGPMLGAYAIALLEYGDAASVEWLVHSQLAIATVSSQSRSALVGALALHDREGNQKYKSDIRTELAKAVLVDSELAFLVNSHFQLSDTDEPNVADLPLFVFGKLNSQPNDP